MMPLTPSEEKIFELLKDGREVPLDDIITHFDHEDKKTARKALVVRMKYLAAKVAPLGWIVTNESGIGRGAKASYKMIKRFKPR